jgi:hypothetical protein
MTISLKDVADAAEIVVQRAASLPLPVKAGALVGFYWGLHEAIEMIRANQKASTFDYCLALSLTPVCVIFATGGGCCLGHLAGNVARIATRNLPI